MANLFYFCHLKKLVRPETFGPYYVYAAKLIIENNRGPFIYGLQKDAVSTSHYVASGARKSVMTSEGSGVGLF